MEINIYTPNHNFKTTFTIKEKHGYENTLSILSTILTLMPIFSRAHKQRAASAFSPRSVAVVTVHTGATHRSPKTLPQHNLRKIKNTFYKQIHSYSPFGLGIGG